MVKGHSDNIKKVLGLDTQYVLDLLNQLKTLRRAAICHKEDTVIETQSEMRKLFTLSILARAHYEQKAKDDTLLMLSRVALLIQFMAMACQHCFFPRS